MKNTKELQKLASLINSTDAQKLDIEELEEIVAPACGCGCDDCKSL